MKGRCAQEKLEAILPDLCWVGGAADWFSGSTLDLPTQTQEVPAEPLLLTTEHKQNYVNYK